MVEIIDDTGIYLIILQDDSLMMMKTKRFYLYVWPLLGLLRYCCNTWTEFDI